MAEKLEELRVYRDARAFCKAISEILGRASCRRLRELADQVREANESITANISEGFEQPTDAGFASFLYYSKGSLAEVVTRLRGAPFESCVTIEEIERVAAQANRLSQSLGALIRYLDTSRFKDRGRFRSRQRQTDGNMRNRMRQRGRSVLMDEKPQGKAERVEKGPGTAKSEPSEPRDQGPRRRSRARPKDQGLDLIRFGGHLPKGGYDVQTDGRHPPAPAAPAIR